MATLSGIIAAFDAAVTAAGFTIVGVYDGADNIPLTTADKSVYKTLTRNRNTDQTGGAVMKEWTLTYRIARRRKSGITGQEWSTYYQYIATDMEALFKSVHSCDPQCGRSIGGWGEESKVGNDIYIIPFSVTFEYLDCMI